jgi:glycerol-3-phosphate acyltransferase PlsX
MLTSVKPHVALAVDAMGGDNAPGSVIGGVKRAADAFPYARFLLFGSPEAEALMKAAGLVDESRFRFYLTQDVVANDDKPSAVIRSGRNSSMWKAVSAVKDGVADAVVSAGNTGALMAMSKLILRSLPGIDRPAIASAFPTFNGSCVLLDLGANVVCDAENLVQFAVMGDAFARVALRLENPKVALLNVGEEDVKGSDVVKRAAEELRSGRYPVNYIGYVEGDGVVAGKADVVVTDGFTGNVALKTAEGTGKMCLKYVKNSFRSSPAAMLSGLLARPYLKRTFMRMDPRYHNGAMFVGLSGIAVKSHGGTDDIGYANAIGVAVNLARHDINGKITELLRAHDGK